MRWPLFNTGTGPHKIVVIGLAERASEIGIARLQIGGGDAWQLCAWTWVRVFFGADSEMPPQSAARDVLLRRLPLR